MLVTKEAAMEMWCPMFRNGNGLNMYRDGEGNVVYCCEGSDCMAWRWFDEEPMDPPREKIEDPNAPIRAMILHKYRELIVNREAEFEKYIDALEKQYREPPPQPSYVPVSWEWSADFSEWADYLFVGWIEPEDEAWDRWCSRRRGYCGLAGKVVNP